MARRHHRPKGIVAKLRQVEVLLAEGNSPVGTVRTLGVTEQTYYWRRECDWVRTFSIVQLNFCLPQIHHEPCDGAIVRP
jgi:hypothetical protein